MSNDVPLVLTREMLDVLADLLLSPSTLFCDGIRYILDEIPDDLPNGNSSSVVRVGTRKRKAKPRRSKRIAVNLSLRF
jgi:hypothetical protein